MTYKDPKERTRLETARLHMMFYVGGPHAEDAFSKDLNEFEAAVREDERQKEKK